MDITQSKKTQLFSLTKLTKEKLVYLHNVLEDYEIKTKIRIFILNLLPGDERVKLQNEEQIEKFFESEGLILKSSPVSTQSKSSVENGSPKVEDEGTVRSYGFQPVQKSSFESTSKENPLDDASEDTEDEDYDVEEDEAELPL